MCSFFSFEGLWKLVLINLVEVFSLSCTWLQFLFENALFTRSKFYFFFVRKIRVTDRVTQFQLKSETKTVISHDQPYGN